MATRFVTITRNEFEDFLNNLKVSGRNPRWKLMDQTLGVYMVDAMGSDRVGIRVASSIGQHDEVVGVGKGAIRIAMVSKINGSVLNKKAADRSHIKRTTNWRKTCTEVIGNFVGAYLKTTDFYEAIADKDAYKSAVLADIEAFPGWKKHPELVNLHTLVGNGNIMNFRQRERLADILDAGPEEEATAPAPQSEPLTVIDQNYLDKLRRLYLAVKGTKFEEFVVGIGKQYKEKGELSQKQRDSIERMFKFNRISAETRTSLHTRWFSLNPAF